MSSFLEEIIKPNTSLDHRGVLCTGNYDNLEIKIKNEINSMEKLTQEDNDKAINSNIENWLFYLKKNITEEYETMKINFRELSKVIIIKEIKSFENEMNRLKDQAMDNQSHINKLKNDIINYKSNIKYLSEKHSRNRNIKIKAHCIYQWRLRREQLQRERFCEKLAIKFHESFVKRKAFYGWKYNLEVSWKDRSNFQIEKNAQSVYKDLANQYEKQIITLKSEVMRLQEENSVMHTTRSTTQDAVKKALMRGVCALNLETMSILNQNGIITESNSDNNFIPQSKKIQHSYDKNLRLYEDDLPRVPLKHSNEIDSSNNSSCQYLESYEHSNGNIRSISKENIFRPLKINVPQYQQSDRLNNQNMMKSIQSYDKMSLNHKTFPSNKSSTITVQAGNPTGSHTQSSLNVKVQKHNINEPVIDSIQKRNGEYYQDKRTFKK